MPESVKTDQYVTVEEWLSLIENEYLDDFIPRGGSAVKFISGDAGVLDSASQRLSSLAETRKLFFARLDPSVLKDEKKPDLHRIEKFFIALTRDIEWQSFAARQVMSYFEKKGLDVTGCDLQDLDAIASRNGRDRQDLQNQYQQELATPVLTDHGLALEFRAALIAIQRALILPQPENPTLDEVVLAWLRGKSMPGGSAVLKKIQIYDRITQNNARHMIISLCDWLPKTGVNGLLTVLDFRPYQTKKLTQSAVNRLLSDAIRRGAGIEELRSLQAKADAGNSEVTYTDAAYVQMLALLRHFIDDIERFRGLLLVVLTDPAFYDDISPRNYNNYDALQTRIGLEVKDAHRADPAAALVHLCE